MQFAADAYESNVGGRYFWKDPFNHKADAVAWTHIMTGNFCFGYLDDRYDDLIPQATDIVELITADVLDGGVFADINWKVVRENRDDGSVTVLVLGNGVNQTLNNLGNDNNYPWKKYASDINNVYVYGNLNINGYIGELF